ncbi:MAG: galactokinase [Candidatus Acidiferrales bacterium]
MTAVFDPQEHFRTAYGAHPRTYRAPGRVNLIGEHTDYNDGFVLPVAIDLSCFVTASLLSDSKIVVRSENYEGVAEFRSDGTGISRSGCWFDYPKGVALLLAQSGYRLRGTGIYIRSEVPVGAGLSSSAALEVATGYALLDLAEYAIDRTRLALLCQRAENEFVGARCGVMDQFIACHGQDGQALLLDCRSLEYHPIPLVANLDLVICNTMVKHDLSVTEYNLRRAECEEGVRLLAQVLPNIRALRDVTLEELDGFRKRLTERIYKRCRHVVTENARVLKAADALQSREIESLPTLMADSHRSLRDDFEVSCAELDLMVDIASKEKGVYGARMTGGGFGGCTINLVNSDDTLEFRQRISTQYFAATGRRPDIYVCSASRGVGPIDLDMRIRSDGIVERS